MMYHNHELAFGITICRYDMHGHALVLCACIYYRLCTAKPVLRNRSSVKNAHPGDERAALHTNEIQLSVTTGAAHSQPSAKT